MLCCYWVCVVSQIVFEHQASNSCHGNTVIDWSSISLQKVDKKAFLVHNSESKAKHLLQTHTKSIQNSILAAGNFEEQKCALMKSLLHPQLQSHTKAVITEIINSQNWKDMSQENTSMPMKTIVKQTDGSSVALKMIENLGGLISMMKNYGGRWTNHAEEFIHIVFASFTDESMISNQICGVVHDLLAPNSVANSSNQRPS